MPKLEMGPEPYGSYNYLVEIDGIVSGGFTEVSGLSIKVKVKEYREGGENTMVHSFPDGTTYGNVELKRGVSDRQGLWDWYADVIDGKVELKSCSICLRDQEYSEVLRWNLFQAYPVEWKGPSLKADSSAVATESIVLAHHGLKRG